MAAVLSSDMDRTEKIIIFRDECEAIKLHVSPPDINKSHYFFKMVDDKHITHGLGAIKGAGEAAIENIVAMREKDGPYKDLFDFCQRIDLHKMNKRVLEALIRSGCFDSLNANRAQLMASLGKALQHAEQAAHNQKMGQQDLLGGLDGQTDSPNYVDIAPWRDEIQLQGEKETLGFYLTGHPLNRYLQELSQFTTCRIAELHPTFHKTARAAGIVTNVRTRQTKRGDRIAIFTLDDGSSQIEVVCFSEAFQKYRALLVEDQLVIAEGEINIDEFSNNPRMLCRDLLTLDQARARFAKSLQISIPKTQLLDMKQLKLILENHLGGNCPIVLRYLKDNIQANIKLGNVWMVNPTDALLDLLRQEAGIGELEIRYGSPNETPFVSPVERRRTPTHNPG